MKKLLLDVEALNVESFSVAGEGRLVGTVEGASGDIGMDLGNSIPATMMLSACASACMQSGILNCIATQTCC